MTLGERILELRKGTFLNQSQLAERVGVNSKQISAYENGFRQPSYAVLIRLADVYKVSIDYLLGLDKNKTIDVSKLSQDEINIISSLVSDMSDKNEKLKGK